jgi:hypothetical protein
MAIPVALAFKKRLYQGVLETVGELVYNIVKNGRVFYTASLSLF